MTIVSGHLTFNRETTMARAKYYSPRLERPLVSRLYHAAKAQGVPMTVLTNRLVAAGLDDLDTAEDRQWQARAAEEPPGDDPTPAD